MLIHGTYLCTLVLLFGSAICSSDECEGGEDSTSLLQTTLKTSPTDEPRMVEDTQEFTSTGWCWFWDHKCIAKVHARWAAALVACRPGSENGPVTEGVHESGSLHLESMMKGMLTKAETYVSCLVSHGAEYSKIKHARFKAKIMSRIVKMLGPTFHKQLANADLGLVNLAQKGSSAVANMAAKGIETIDWIEYVISSKVKLAVDDVIKQILNNVMPQMWTAAGAVEQTLDGSLVVELGTIPLVGGVLAEIASKTLTEVYGRMKEGVTLSISNLLTKIGNQTIKAIVSEACKPLDNVKSGIMKLSDMVVTASHKLEKVGLDIAKTIGNAKQAEFAKQAEEGEKEAAGLHSSIMSIGKDTASSIKAHSAKEKEEGKTR